MTASTAGESARPDVDVARLVERADQQLRDLDRPDLAERVRRELRRLRHPTSEVLVVGEFKKGKSTLVNALLNARIAPSDADRFTSVPLVVHHGRRLRVHALLGGTGDDEDHDLLADGRGRDLELGQLQDVATDVGEPAGSDVRSVIIEMPRELLEAGLVLVDTPGVGGGLGGRHATTTLRALAMASAVVFVSDASQELTAPEVDLLEQVRRLCPTVVCVCTKVDAYPEWRRILEIDRDHLRRRGLPDEILPLASPLRHRAVRTGDADLEEASGYPALVTWLREEVLEQEDDLRVRAAASVVFDALAHVTAELDDQLAIARDPEVSTRANDRLAQARADSDRITAAATNWRAILGDRYEDLALQVDADRRLRMQRLRDEMSNRVDDSDVVAQWDELEAWFRARANEELVGHFAEMRERAEGVARDVLARFELELDGVDLLRGLAVPDGAEVPDGVQRPKLEQMTRTQAMIATARGSSGGMIVGSTATATAGSVVGFLVAAPVGAVLGVGLAAVFGRRTLASARDAEKRMHRVEATKALSRHLEQVDVVARMDSLRMMKRVRQRLANYLDVRAEEARVTAARRQAATVEAMKQDQAELHRRLARLERTRAAVTELSDEAAAVAAVTTSREPVAAGG